MTLLTNLLMIAVTFFLGIGTMLNADLSLQSRETLAHLSIAQSLQTKAPVNLFIEPAGAGHAYDESGTVYGSEDYAQHCLDAPAYCADQSQLSTAGLDNARFPKALVMVAEDGAPSAASMACLSALTGTDATVIRTGSSQVHQQVLKAFAGHDGVTASGASPSIEVTSFRKAKEDINALSASQQAQKAFSSRATKNARLVHDSKPEPITPTGNTASLFAVKSTASTVVNKLAVNTDLMDELALTDDAGCSALMDDSGSFEDFESCTEKVVESLKTTPRQDIFGRQVKPICAAFGSIQNPGSVENFVKVIQSLAQAASSPDEDMSELDFETMSTTTGYSRAKSYVRKYITPDTTIAGDTLNPDASVWQSGGLYGQTAILEGLCAFQFMDTQEEVKLRKQASLMAAPADVRHMFIPDQFSSGKVIVDGYVVTTVLNSEGLGVDSLARQPSRDVNGARNFVLATTTEAYAKACIQRDKNAIQAGSEDRCLSLRKKANIDLAGGDVSAEQDKIHTNGAILNWAQTASDRELHAVANDMAQVGGWSASDSLIPQ